MIWNDKPYLSLNHYLNQQFGEKVYKLALQANVSCPNRDGMLDHRGCIFCSPSGSGDFAADKDFSITDQIRLQKERTSAKNSCRKYIAYFQSFTNTYAPLQYLRAIFMEALSSSDICALSIATRPDCLNDEVLHLLQELNNIKPVWVELGLQTIHEDTAHFIRRGYALPCFEQAIQDLHVRNLDVIVHVILGLPHESREQMLETIYFLNHQGIQGIKLHLMHVLKGTDLDSIYMSGGYTPLTLDEYAHLVVDCVERLSKDIVIHRITGDGPKDLLRAPLWSLKKKTVLGRIHHFFKIRNTWQGHLLENTDTNGGYSCQNH